MNKKIEIGKLIHQIRKERQLTLKYVAKKIDIDLTLLSKIENGERQIQPHMLKPLADVFNLSYKELQIQFLNQKIHSEFGNEPYYKEAIEILLNDFKK